MNQTLWRWFTLFRQNPSINYVLYFFRVMSNLPRSSNFHTSLYRTSKIIYPPPAQSKCVFSWPKTILSKKIKKKVSGKNFQLKFFLECNAHEHMQCSADSTAPYLSQKTTVEYRLLLRHQRTARTSLSYLANFCNVTTFFLHFMHSISIHIHTMK